MISIAFQELLCTAMIYSLSSVFEVEERTYSGSKLLVVMRTSYQYLVLLSSTLVGFILLSDFMTILISATIQAASRAERGELEVQVA